MPRGRAPRKPPRAGSRARWRPPAVLDLRPCRDALPPRPPPSLAPRLVGMQAKPGASEEGRGVIDLRPLHAPAPFALALLPAENEASDWAIGEAAEEVADRMRVRRLHARALERRPEARTGPPSDEHRRAVATATGELDAAEHRLRAALDEEGV